MPQLVRNVCIPELSAQCVHATACAQCVHARVSAQCMPELVRISMPELVRMHARVSAHACQS